MKMNLLIRVLAVICVIFGMLPGVSAGVELMSGLYVHGGDGTDNLYLLDDVPLFQVSHLAGLFSSFNTDVIDNGDFDEMGQFGRISRLGTSIQRHIQTIHKGLLVKRFFQSFHFR